MVARRKSTGWIAGVTLLLAGVVAADSPIGHFAPRTVAEVGRTRIIAIRVDPPLPSDRTLPATVSDPAVLSIVRPAFAGAGATVGYIRVRGETPGRATLDVAGATLEVDVVPPRAPAAATRFTPTIVGPVSGAAVWGVVSVGVETRLAPGAGPLPAIRVRVAGARILEPAVDTGVAGRPYRRLRFELDANAFEPGPLALETLIDGAPLGPATIVRVVRPPQSAIAAGEAEATYSVERPARFADPHVNVGRHADASGGAYFANAGATPAVCFPVDVETPGWYQVMIVAGGTEAQGALPTVGVVVDGADESITNARLLDSGFHRIAVGVPFRLDAGRRIITPFFANDFYVPRRADRNLHLDYIEVARLRDAEDAHRSNAMAAMAPMMPMTPMTPMTTMTGDAGGMKGGMAGADDDAALVMNVDDPDGAAAVPLRIAFVRPLDGLPIPGLIEIEGRAWWVDDEFTDPPTVTLMVNDFPAMKERSGAPRFRVDPSNFWEGDNTIRLVARLDDGTTATTPVQTMHWPAAPRMSPPPRHHRRFSIHEPAWDSMVAAHLHPGHYPKERRTLVLFSNTTATLNVPEGMVGRFDVYVEALGEDFEGPPRGEVALVTPGGKIAIGAVEPPAWWDTRRVGEVELPPGPKDLTISFVNDHHEPGKGDRNLRIQAVMLAEQPTVPDTTAPEAVIRYPENGQRVHLADALVAEVSDDASLAHTELIVDDVPTGATVDLNLEPGRVVFPLLLRSLAPGEHTVTVRTTDAAGNSTLAEPRTIVVTAGAPPAPGPYEHAVRVLNAFGYGPSAADLAVILTRGPEAWLRDQLARGADDAAEQAALGAGLTHFANRNPYEVGGRTLSHLLLTQNPARARFVLWAENHFSTWIRKVEGSRKWEEHLAFGRLGAAPFDTLLFASAESPAMLAYLDQDGSYADRLNENYAREIMELHTLGVDGGYTQTDVTNLAALLTGWTAALEGDGRGGGPNAQTYSFRYDPRLNDGDAIRVLGMPFDRADPDARYDRARLGIELLAAHPSTARFVARKLAGHYVSSPPPSDLVETLAQRFHETGGDMRELLLTIAADPRIVAPNGYERIATPLDYGVRLLRASSHFNPWRLAEFLQLSGNGVFDRATPDGYPQEDAAYTDSNAMVQRLKLAKDNVWQIAALVPGPWRYGDDVPEDEWTQLVIDVLAVRLTGRVLSAPSNAAAIDVLTAATGTRDERVRVVGPFIASLPEANLR